MDIAVLIPTMRRPESLERALRSVFAQTGVADRMREILVIDNDPRGSARSLVEALQADSPYSLIYCPEPRPGVATARNTGLTQTTAPLIAFLDDDEAAEPDWLSRLIAAQERLGADVVFGPIRGRVPDGTGWAADYLERFFGREGPDQTRLIDHAYGCGNSLMVRAKALPGPAPFDTSADRSGGEDDALFQALEARGGRFGWAADAWVDEFAPPHRATLGYALTRAFAYGQSPSQLAARDGKPLQILRWMLIGAAQTGVWGLAAGLLTLTGSPLRAEMLDRAARGLGKVLWFKGLEPQFYGARELARLDRLEASA
jgi:succinoglycan biosynthesis protein ExoM